MPVPAHYDLIHEDDSIVVVNKPSGLPTMPAGGFVESTLLALVREQYPEASPLHRLGRGTSGLVLFARHKQAASQLARAWRDRTVKKTYRALGLGSTRTEMFVIDVPIGPVPHPLIGTVQAACEGGKPHTASLSCSSSVTIRRCSASRSRRDVRIRSAFTWRMRVIH